MKVARRGVLPETKHILNGGKVFLAELRVRLHRLVSRLPPSRTHFIRILLHIPQCLHIAKWESRTSDDRLSKFSKLPEVRTAIS